VSPPIDAVLLCGGRIDGEFAEEAGTEIKALISFHGRPLAGHALAALRGSGRVRRVLAVGPPAVEQAISSELDGFLAEGTGGPENIRRALESVRVAPRAILCATDMPFVTDAAIASFLEAVPSDARASYSIVRREEFQRAFPGSVNRFVPFRDAWLTGGGAVLVDPVAALERWPLVESLFAGRKSALRMARIVGAPILLRLLTGRLHVADVTARVGRLTGVPVAAVSADPALAFDIDAVADLRYARARLVGW
jgi:GTP:adenosylcobinamide-phosphate guanylyltransferase